MKQPIFEGVCTALATPFEDQGIDYENFDRLLEHQTQAGVTAFVVCGTTGEAATMSDDEQHNLIRYCVKHTHSQTVIAGTGTNDTTHTLRKCLAAEDAGADALLVVTPYYNKGNHDGILRHYETIADCVHIPVILYNVPSRTGVNLTPEQYAILSQHPNIGGVKEASGNLSQVLRTQTLCGPDFHIWSGNDDQIVPMMALGAKGVISVLSNLVPEVVLQMTTHCQQSNYDDAAQLQCNWMDLIDSLFCEANPIPLKAALRYLGIGNGQCRLPLGELSVSGKQQLIKAMLGHNLL